MTAGQFRMVRCTMPGAEAVLAQSQRSFARHTHDRFGIGVVERGGQRSHSGRGEVEAGPGDVITVNPGEVHDGAPVGDAGRTWRILYLDPAVVTAAASGIDDGNDFELTRPVLRDPRAGRLVHRLFGAATSTGDAIEREELLLALLVRLGRARPCAAAPMRPEIARARRRIDDDPAAAVTLADLAAASGLSRFQVLRGFTRATGLTPHAYLVQRRVDLARRLIAAGTTLAETAVASGFADQSHMTRSFVTRYGVTPGVYADAVC